MAQIQAKPIQEFIVLARRWAAINSTIDRRLLRRRGPKVRGEGAKRLCATHACPFSNLPEKRRTMWALTAREMKECHLVTPRLVAQIEFTKWTPDGHLRYASFVGLRNDKEPLRVVRE
jgi:hypothetical protein